MSVIIKLKGVTIGETTMSPSEIRTEENEGIHNFTERKGEVML